MKKPPTMASKFQSSIAKTEAVGGTSEVKTINGQSCVVGPTLGFDIDDAYAFDIDEPVELALTYVPAQTTAQTLVVLFDKSGGDGRGSIDVTPERSGTTAGAKLRLDRARFAGQGAQVGGMGKDFAEPTELTALAHLGVTGVDEWAIASLKFPGALSEASKMPNVFRSTLPVSLTA